MKLNEVNHTVKRSENEVNHNFNVVQKNETKTMLK